MSLRLQHSVLLATLTFAALVADAPPTAAQQNTSHPEIILGAPAGCSLGQPIDTDGTTLVATGWTPAGPGCIVWVRTPEEPGWVLQDLVPLDAWSVAVSGERIYVGCLGHSPEPGYVVVLHRSGTHWLTEAVVQPSDGLGSTDFGWSVAVQGDTLVVGDTSSAVLGAVYVFQRSGQIWTQVARLLPGDPTWEGTFFGNSVALSGDTLAVGMPEDGLGGAVYIFTGAGASWTQQAKLVTDLLGTEAWLGFALALEGDTLAAGAPLAKDAAGINQTGAAVIFQRHDGTWVAATRLPSPPQLDGNCEFVGWSMSLVGGLVACGAPYANSDLGIDATGAVQLFGEVGGVWTLLDVLRSDAIAVYGAGLGIGADIAGQRVFGCAPNDAGGGTIHGFWIGGSEPEVWIDLGYGLAGVAGVPLLAGTGTLQVGAPGALSLAQAAPGALCLGLVSLAVTPTPFRGGTFVAIPAQLELLGVTDAQGQVELSWSDIPPGTPAGLAFTTQFAVVDTSAPAGVAVSNALAAVIQP